MEILLQDLRYSLRNLLKSPGFTAVALVTLALGIGANTAIFSVVNAVLLRALPYADPDRLVVVLHEGHSGNSSANFLDWRRDNQVFENMGAAEGWTPNLTGVDKPEAVSGLHVTSDIFPVLGVRPILGRTLTPDEDQPGHDHEVVLSYGVWQRRFGGSKDVLGRTVEFNGEAYAIIGVMPAGFRFAFPSWATRADVWGPLPLNASDRVINSKRIFARMKPGVSLNQARAEMATITARLEKQFPGTNKDVVVSPLKEQVIGDLRPALLVLLGAVGFVLLIACANIAHMLLARASAREREIAVRTALGASRRRILRQFLTESALLALIGGCVGVLMATWGLRVLLAWAPEDITKFGSIAVDGHVLTFALVISLITGIAFGLAPALQGSALNVIESLKEGCRGSGSGRHSRRIRSLLVASEFALALVLLAGAGLMIRTFIALASIDPGFNPHHLLTMIVSVAGANDTAAKDRTTFYQRALERIQGLPGVISASAINHLPLAGDDWNLPFFIEGRPIPKRGEELGGVYRVVLPGYFRTMNIPLLRGRDFADHDTQNAPEVVIISEFMAQRHWPGEDAIGKRISIGLEVNGTPSQTWRTIIGITPTVVRRQWSAPAEEEYYLPYLQNPVYRTSSSPHYEYMSLVVRTAGDAAAQAPAIQNAIRSENKTVTLSEVQTMEEVVAEANAQPRFYLYLIAAFAAVALVLAAVGIYGVMSHSVSRRMHEMAVRMALGAQQSEVRRLIVGESMLPAVVGATIGLLGALVLTPMMKTLLYGVRANDPVTFVTVAIVLGAVALLASYIPARRATKVDPIVALRYE
ncbi:MAG TPA: ABC transporter permease [Terriglobales bacterium]|nr:ABC transporter permease [Terriglobales bacterium]